MRINTFPNLGQGSKVFLDRKKLITTISCLVLSLLIPLLLVYNKNILIFVLVILYSIFTLTIIKDGIIYIIITLSFTIDYVIYLFGLPSYAAYFLHLNIFIYIVHVLFQLKQRNWRIKNNPLLVMWMIYMVVIAVVNSPISILTLQRMISYFLFPLLFMATIYREGPQVHDNHKISFLIFCIAIQIPVAMVQKAIYWNWSGEAGQMAVDRVGGTFGWAGTGLMAVMMGAAFCYCFTNWLYKKTIGSFMVMLIPFIPLALGSAKTGFVYAFLGGIVVLAVFSFDPTQPVLRKVIGLFAVTIPILVVFLVSLLMPKFDPSFDSSTWKAFTSPSYFIEYTTGFVNPTGATDYGPARRLEQINFVNTVTTNKWFGIGIGALSYSDLLGIGPNNTFLTETLAWTTSITRQTLESGIVGTVIYILLLLSFIPITGKLLKMSIRFGKNRVVLTSFPALVLIFVVSCIYSDAWRFYGTACVFWLSAGIVWKQYQRNKNIIDNRGWLINIRDKASSGHQKDLEAGHINQKG